MATSSTGAGTIPTTYRISVDHSTPVTIAASGTRTVTQLSAGSHSVQLLGIPTNCTSDWYAPQPVTVVADSASAAAFAVECDVPIANTLIAIGSPLGGPGDLYAIPLDGGTPHPLTQGLLASVPAVSPGGTRIAFVTGFESNVQLVTMNTDGSRMIVLDSFGTLADTKKVSPTWAPDGTRLAYSTGSDVRIVTADGRADSVVALGDSPAWSPDGSRLAIVAYGNIKVLDLTTGDAPAIRQATNGSQGFHPAWSPDGATIAYVDFHTDGVDSLITSTALVNADGSNDRDLARPAVVTVAWSSDGTRLASEDDAHGPEHIYWMDLATRTRHDLANPPGVNLWGPSWAP